MALNRAYDDYEKSIQPDKPFTALLGGFVAGTFQFIVATNPTLAYVRHLDGFQTTAKHRNRVDLTLDPTDADNQDIPIALYYDEYGDLAIWGGDPDQFGAILERDPTAGAGGVKRVISGTNVTVDNTDPTRPIINASGGGAVSGSLYFEDTPVSLNNSTTPTSIFSGSGPGSLALAPNFFAVAGRVIEIEWGGNIGADAGSPALFTFAAGFVGGLFDSIAFFAPASLSGTYKVHARFYCVTPGVTADFAGEIVLIVYDGFSGLSYSYVSFPSGIAVADTTGALTLDASITMSVADPDNLFNTVNSPTTVSYTDPN